MLSSKLITRTSLQIICKTPPLGNVFANQNSIRTAFLSNRHWNPKWKKLRGLKVIKINLPDFHKERKPLDEMTPDDMRSYYKEEGMQPHRPWYEKDITVYATADFFEPYVPPEGDGKLSPLNAAGAKQKIEWLKKKKNSWSSLRTIRKYEDDFELYPDFVEKAQDIYIKAHNCLMNREYEDLIKYATEKAYPEMMFNTYGRTIRWKFIKSLEPPRVSHIRHTSIMEKENIFGQITVRFHSQQTLAIYDRFGRLIYGNESIGKDVLEYVVFEKQLINLYGSWRVHGKIIPEWNKRLEVTPRTYVLPDQPEKELEQTQSEGKTDSAKTLVNIPTKVQ